ncbi:MAG: hypothetical protein HQM08_28150 [Candidatus Riflebacteria bacterium]|nr:hypothetical protein [Candidatus Riflebacteria bacterium]
MYLKKTGLLRASLIFFFLSCFFTIPAFAVPTLFSDSCSVSGGNATATIGSVINYDLYVTADSSLDTPIYGMVEIAPGGNKIWLDSAVVGGNLYHLSKSYTVTEGNENAWKTPTQYLVIASGSTSPTTMAATSFVYADNMRPKTDGSSMTITIVGTGTWSPGQYIKKGDKLIFSQGMDSFAFQTSPATETAVLDLTTLKGPVNYTMTAANPHVSMQFAVPDSLDTIAVIGFSAKDPYGNTLTNNSILNIPVDTTPPFISQATVSPSNPMANDLITLTIQLKSYDSDSVTAYCPWLSTDSITLVNSPGTPNFSVTLPLVSSPPEPPFNGLASCSFIVTDKANNIASVTKYFQINNMLPNMKNQPLASLTQVVESKTDGIGIIGDFLTFSATATFNPDQDAQLTVDLSPIGGPSALKLPSVSIPTNSFLLNWKITPGTSEENIAKQFVVTAKDNTSGNVIASWTTPPIYIDNNPPLFNGVASVTRVSGSGTAYIIGDQIKIKVEVASVPGDELGAVTVDLASLSTAYSSFTPLTRASPDSETFEGVFTVGNFPTAGGGLDGKVNFRILASDSQGNVASIAISSALPIDNEFPNVMAAIASWQPGVGSIGPSSYVRASDTLEFRVQITPGHTDLKPITIDLSPLLGDGISTNQVMTASSAPGWYFYRINEVPVGNLRYISKTFSVTIADSHGNAATPTITVPFNTAPTIQSMQVSCLRGNKILYGDSASVTVVFENVYPSTGSVTIDLSRFDNAYSTTENMEWLGANTWRKTFIASNSTSAPPIDQTNWLFSVTAGANGSPGSFSISSTSAPILVDTERPVLTSIVFSPASSTIGTILNLSVKLASSSSQPHDGENVTIDLSSVGDTIRTMTFSGNGSYTYQLVVATGTLNNGATFPVTISDNDGNVITSNIIIPSFDNRPPSTGSFSLSVSLRANAQDLTGSNFVNLNKALAFRIPYSPLSPDDNATATIDLSLIGWSSSTPMVQSNGSYSLTINPATVTANISDPAYQFTSTIYDSNGNKAFVQTPQFQVDCHPPKILVASATTGGGTSATAKVGDNIDFAVQVIDNDGLIPVIDLTKISGSSVFALTQKSDTTDWYVGSYNIPPGSFTGITSWTVSVKDNSSNYAVSSTNNLNVNMKPAPPAFSNLTVWKSFASNPNLVASMANVNDQITVTVNIQDQAALVATLTYVEFASQALPLNAVATSQFSLLSAPNLYQAVFTVTDQNGWGVINYSTMSVKLTAQDTFGNISTYTASTTIGIDNFPPIILGQNWTVSPNIASATFNGLKVINVGSGTTVDLLWASATIDTPLSSAFINLSGFPGGPATVPVNFYFDNAGHGVASVASGISFANFTPTDWMVATITLSLTDLAGNQSVASQSFYFDNNRPSISAVNFDGATLSVTLNENAAALNASKWELWGSTTTGLSTYTTLSNYNLTFDEIDFTVSSSSLVALACWAVQPIYLKVKNDTQPAMNDFAGNWVYAYDAFPVNISDSKWRETPVVNSMTVTQGWSLPNSTFTVDLVFSKQMDPATLVASHGVLFVQPADFSSIDYQTGYVFQQVDQNGATWYDNNTRLRFQICGLGADWLARKLGNSTVPLNFATRGPYFCKDIYGKNIQAVSSGSPVSSTVPRPYTGISPLSFNVENSSGNLPCINLGTGFARICFSDRALLFQNDFKASDSIKPVLGLENPTSGKAETGFHGNIELHDVDASPATYAVLDFENLKVENNSSTSSTTAILNLTDSDRNNILAMFRNNAHPNWRLKVGSGAFHNWWSQPNVQYYPTEPGGVLVTTFTPTLPTLLDCSISNYPPVKNHTAQDLIFEFEISPVPFGNGVIPITSVAPTARIASLTGEQLATGTFLGWSTRIVDNQTRYIARFNNTTSFSGTLAACSKINARLEIFGVTDALGNSMGTGIGTTVYDLNAKSDSSVTGFSTGSTTFVIDMMPPVVSKISLSGAIMQADIGNASLTVWFNESMNQGSSYNPTLSLATISAGLSYSIPYNFSSWDSATQARFLNAVALTRDIPQGTWTVNLTAWDLAQNQVDTATIPALLVRTQGPNLDSWQIISMQSTTSKNSTDTFINQPFSGSITPGIATLSMKFHEPPREPVYIQFADAGVTVASWQLIIDSGKAATFTWPVAAPYSGVLPYAAPTKTYQIKLYDRDGNPNPDILSWTRDDEAPLVSLDKITGGVNSGITSQAWFNPALHTSINMNWTVTGEAQAPILRVRDSLGLNATETTVMTGAGTQWIGKFTGKRKDNTPLPEGDYIVDIVDSAGNICVPNGGPSISNFDITLDVTPPVVSSFSFLVNGANRSKFNPNFATLTVLLDTTETLCATGIYQIDIRTDSNSPVFVASSAIVASDAGLIATWNGRRSNGTLVSDGNYRIYGSDITGNRSIAFSRIAITTSDFKVISATQTGSRTVDIRFDHELDFTVFPASSAFGVSPAGPLVATVTMNPTTISLIFDSSLADGQNSISVNLTSVRSVEGNNLAAGKNTATVQFDAVAPTISGVSFDNLTYANQVVVDFNKAVTIPSGSLNSVFLLYASGSAISITNATVRSDNTTILLTAANNFDNFHLYSLAIQGVKDWIGNVTTPDTASTTFIGPDRTPPVFSIAEFSNPANEYDIMVALHTDKDLFESPTLQVDQGGASTQILTMAPGSVAKTYMSGLHLSSTGQGNGTLTVSGRDKSSNYASATYYFTTATVKANVLSQITSPDGNFQLVFKPGTFKSDAFVKILPQNLETVAPSKQILPSMRNIAENILKATVRAASSDQLASQSELIAVYKGYEVSCPIDKLNKVFDIKARLDNSGNATSTALFRLDDTGLWQYVGKKSTAGWHEGSAIQAGVYAILADTVPPRLNIKTNVKPNVPLTSDRPEFQGNVADYGSGVKDGSVVAVLDGFEHPVEMATNGDFKFAPLSALISGDHELYFKASDLTDNVGKSPTIKFSVNVPLVISEVMNYPNPANRTAVIRVCASRPDVTGDLLGIKLYDIAGHKVRELENVQMSRENTQATSRYIYEARWDLKNEDGVKVANGIYLARIELKDPDGTGKTVKKTHKIAVLR